MSTIRAADRSPELHVSLQAAVDGILAPVGPKLRLAPALYPPRTAR